MSQSFDNATPDSMLISSSDLAHAGVPITIACWVYPTDTTGAQCYAGIGDSASDNEAIFLRQNNTTGAVRIIHRVGGASAAADAGNVTTGAWNHVAGTTTTASRYAYLNGTAGSENTTAKSAFTGTIQGFVGRRETLTPVQAYDGQIAELGIWSVVLTAGEIAELAAGRCPLFIRPASLEHYIPFWNDEDKCFRTGISLTNQSGAPAAGPSHPPVLRGRRGRSMATAARAGSGTASFAFDLEGYAVVLRPESGIFQVSPRLHTKYAGPQMMGAKYAGPARQYARFAGADAWGRRIAGAARQHTKYAGAEMMGANSG